MLVLQWRNPGPYCGLREPYWGGRHFSSTGSHSQDILRTLGLILGLSYPGDSGRHMQDTKSYTRAPGNHTGHSGNHTDKIL